MQHSEHLNELGAALAKAQAQVKGARKDSSNPFFKSQYADLASVWEACRDALTSNGLSVIQLPGFADGIATLDTILLHSSGQWISGTAGAPLGKQDAQGVGSAITYLRRYALAAVASVSPEDDDGNAASAPKKSRQPQPVELHHGAPIEERGGADHSPKRSAAPKDAVALSPQPLDEKPKALAEEEPMPWEGPTRETPWPGPGPTNGKSVREWTSKHLRMAFEGTVKVPEEWLPVIQAEIKARSYKSVAERAIDKPAA